MSYTFDIKPIEEVAEIDITDDDVVLVRDASEGNALKRGTFSRIADFIRDKFADLIEAIA